MKSFDLQAGTGVVPWSGDIPDDLCIVRGLESPVRLAQVSSHELNIMKLNDMANENFRSQPTSYSEVDGGVEFYPCPDRNYLVYRQSEGVL